MSLDLPSETGFTLDLNPDSIIKYPFTGDCVSVHLSQDGIVYRNVKADGDGFYHINFDLGLGLVSISPLPSGTFPKLWTLLKNFVIVNS